MLLCDGVACTHLSATPYQLSLLFPNPYCALSAAVASGTLTLAQAQALFTQTACASAAASATSTGPSASPPPGMSKAPPPGMASLVPQFLPPPGLPPPATATGATPASAAVLTPVSAPTAAHTPLVAPAATNAPPLLQPAPPPPLSFAQYLAATAALQQKQKTLQQQLQVQQQQQQQSVSPPSAPQPPQQGTGLRIGPGVFLPPGLALPPGLVLPAASGFGAANASAPIPGAVPHMAPPPIGAGAVAQQLAAMQLGSPQVGKTRALTFSSALFPVPQELLRPVAAASCSSHRHSVLFTPSRHSPQAAQAHTGPQTQALAGGSSHAMVSAVAWRCCVRPCCPATYYQPSVSVFFSSFPSPLLPSHLLPHSFIASQSAVLMSPPYPMTGRYHKRAGIAFASSGIAQPCCPTGALAPTFASCFCCASSYLSLASPHARTSPAA